jgi:hypothetical protein
MKIARAFTLLPWLVACGNPLAPGSPTAPRQPGQCVSFDADAPCLPDDPPGLLRIGDGRFSKGSAGPTGQGRGRVITVTSTRGDYSTGSVLWAQSEAQEPNGGPYKIVIPPTLHGTIELQERWVVRAPYGTIDCSQAPSDFAITMRCAGPCERFDEAGPLIGSTHDVVVHGCRGHGDFDPADPQVPTNDLSVIGVTFNSVPVRYAWDPLWANKTADERKIAHDILWSRNSADLCRDDCGIAFDGVRDWSAVGWLITRSWHPMTWGGIKPWGFGEHGARRRLTLAYSVFDQVGSRAPRVTEAVDDYRIVRTICSRLAKWVVGDTGQYVNPNTCVWLEDDYAEHRNGHILGNLEVRDAQAVPQPDSGAGACTVGSSGAVGSAGCERCGNCSVPPTDYARCNPAIRNQTFLVLRNQWVASDCTTNPPGWDGVIQRQQDGWFSRVLQRRVPPVPTIPELAWEQVLDMVGPPNRNAREQAVIDFLKARLPAS